MAWGDREIRRSSGRTDTGLSGSRYRAGWLAPPRTRGRLPPAARRHIVRVALALAITAVVVPVGAAISATRHAFHARRHDGFSLQATPAKTAVPQGHRATVTLRTNANNGSVRRIFFRLLGLPAGVSAHFRPASVKPGHASKLILSTTSSAPLGTYSLVVSASAVGRQRRSRGLRSHLASLSRDRGRTVKRSTTVITVVLVSGAIAIAQKGVPTHVATWAYGDCNGSNAEPTSLVRTWVTYLESNCGTSSTKVLGACHAAGVTYCTAVQYLDANWIYQKGSVPVQRDAQESWWLHEPGYSDSGHRVSVSAYDGGNLLNQSNPAVQSWFRNYVRANYDPYAALMMDDSSASLNSELYGSGFTTSSEITSDAQLQAAHEAMAAAMTHTDGTPFLQIDNALSPNDNLTPPFPMLGNPAAVTGLVSEGSPMDDGTLTSYYSTLLDEMAYVDGTSDEFVVLLSYDTSASLQARRVQEGTILLGYGPGHTVDWADLDTDSSRLEVWPEEGIVPADPVQSMGEPGGVDCLAGSGVVCSTGGHNDLQVTPGVYRREFAACYDQGAPIGPCATIVNTTGAPITIRASWLTQTYGHQITMNGGDVQSGGTVDADGATFTAGSTSVPADDAVLLGS